MTEGTSDAVIIPYWRLLAQSFSLGFQSRLIGLGYLGGFVARASSVGISLFIPLYVNTYFNTAERCKFDRDDSLVDKSKCQAAYILAAELTGVSQLVALICAPIFGFLADRYRLYHVPLLGAAVAGIVGYVGFTMLEDPEIGGSGRRPWILIFVALIGLSQIGCIVCSLGLIGRGILGLEGSIAGSKRSLLYYSREGSSPENHCSLEPASDGSQNEAMHEENREDSALLGQDDANHQAKNHIKGSIAGIYSLAGGAGILLLTKLGGSLFDTTSHNAPFYMLAAFNATLLVFICIFTLVDILKLKLRS